MSSYVFQFFCGDGKVGTRGSDPHGRDMLSLPAPSHLAPPPRPRPSTAPQTSRLPPQGGERGTRQRRGRARSNSESLSQRRPRQRSARSPRRRRRSRTPTARHQEQAGPILPPGNWHPAPDPQFPPPRLFHHLFSSHAASRAPPASSSASSSKCSAWLVFNKFAMASCTFSTTSTFAAV